MKLTTIITTALLTSCLLIGCADKGSLVKLSYENDMFVNKSAGLSYRYAPLCYEPGAIGEPYAYCKNPELTLCEIPGLNPKFWLTEEYAGSATTVLYSDTLTLPTLGEMDADTVYVCATGERVFSLTTIEDDGLIDRLVNAFEAGEATSLPHTEPELLYSLKFASEKKLPGIYYSLNYAEYEEEAFFYVQGGGRCVEIGNLFNEILDGGAE